uniref:Putative secreted protein n=1 Tax=Anopheles darlingi TaxID=43151 RepID=A0A2M4DG67_ANODA
MYYRSINLFRGFASRSAGTLSLVLFLRIFCAAAFVVLLDHSYFVAPLTVVFGCDRVRRRRRHHDRSRPPEIGGGARDEKMLAPPKTINLLCNAPLVNDACEWECVSCELFILHPPVNHTDHLFCIPLVRSAKTVFLRILCSVG